MLDANVSLGLSDVEPSWLNALAMLCLTEFGVEVSSASFILGPMLLSDGIGFCFDKAASRTSDCRFPRSHLNDTKSSSKKNNFLVKI